MLKKKPVLKEGFFDDFDASDYGHLGLDAIALLSSLVPVKGTAVSFVADMANALWYLYEGKKITAGLYAIMAIPIVGDVLALPIQAALKLGGKGISSIPGVKTALSKFASENSLVKKGVEKLSSSKLTRGLVEPIEEINTKILQAFEKDGPEGSARIIEEYAEKVQKEALEKGTGKAAEKGVEAAPKSFGAVVAEKAKKSLLKRVIPKVSSAVEDGGSTSATSKPKHKSGGGSGGGRSCANGRLGRGCKGENVKSLQQNLLDCGEKLPRKGVDGFFGPETKSAVRSFQDSHELPVDGIAGKETLNALSSCRKSNASSEKDTGEEKVSPSEESNSNVDSDTQPVTTAPASSTTKEPTGKLKSTPYWMTNKWADVKDSRNSAEKEKVKQELISKGYADETNWEERKSKGIPMQESKIQKNYFLKTISDRHEQVEKLVFERLIKNAN